MHPETESELITLCLELIGQAAILSDAERELVRMRPTSCLAPDTIEATRQAIMAGADPLGMAFTSIRSATERRGHGAIYTPHSIVRSMLDWLMKQGLPARIVDPGAGSGRFIIEAGQAFPMAELVAVEIDPLAALMLRANLEVRGMAHRTTILVRDYREISLPPRSGMTAFIGNPPYVRHHDIAKNWKTWYTTEFARFGIKASALAGLHLHFFLQTRRLARAGDIGAFITSAEWLDVNYGAALRRLLLEELGGLALQMLEPTVEVFPGTATTAAITGFRVGEKTSSLRVRAVTRLDQLDELTQGIDLPRTRLADMPRWSASIRPAAPVAAGEVELGDLFRVHRGQVTGANAIWIAGERAAVLPERVKLPAITKARDLIQAGAELGSCVPLRRVIDLPVTLDGFTEEEQRHIGDFLTWAQAQGADQSYIARHRKAWWSVGLKPPAPILCTYMARRPPQFTLNSCGARHINIAHGLYPREALPAEFLSKLVIWLNQNIQTSNGRTYAGGLTKFEPKEIERLRIPRPESLLA